MTRVVLASASLGRRKVLRGAGIDPLVIVSGVDEDAVVASLGRDAGPAETVNALASAKAVRCAARLAPDVAADCVVIGCDSMLHIDGQLRGKPATAAAAREAWQAMAGRSGVLYTGHCVIRTTNGHPAHRDIQSASATVHFGTPTAADLAAYVASGEPLGVAGAFTLDGLGGWFVDGIDGAPSTVIGLSLPLVRTMLADAGVRISAAWESNPV